MYTSSCRVVRCDVSGYVIDFLFLQIFVLLEGRRLDLCVKIKIKLEIKHKGPRSIESFYRYLCLDSIEALSALSESLIRIK